MTTPVKTLANQRNAARSTGPRTPEGKAKSSRNARRHGILSKEVVLPDEDSKAYHVLLDRMWNDLGPDGALEEAMVERISAAWWRLCRVFRVESAVIAWLCFSDAEQVALREARKYVRDDFDKLASSMTTVTDAARHDLAVRQAMAAKEQQDSSDVAIGRAYALDTNARDVLGCLAKYEVAIERGLYRALHELQQLQATRERSSAAHPELAEPSGAHAPGTAQL